MKNKSIMFSFLALSIFSVHAMDLSLVSSSPKKVPSVRTFGDESRIQVFHHGKDFYIKENQNPELKCVHSYDVDPLLKKMNSDQLAQFQRAAGYIVAKRLSNGEYKLRARVNGDGGGPTTGICAYWTTKVVGYIGYGVATFYDPELVAHYIEISAAIETAAEAALYAGTVAPTP